MNDHNTNSLNPAAENNNSDNEFYDACDTMEHKLGMSSMTDEIRHISETLETTQPDVMEKSSIEHYDSDDDDEQNNEEFMTMKTDFKNFESKEFLDRHENLTNHKEAELVEEKFVPLSEKLNREMKMEKERARNSENEHEDEEDENSGEAAECDDPFYVDEELLKKEFDLFSEEQLEVGVLFSFFLIFLLKN